MQMHMQMQMQMHAIPLMLLLSLLLELLLLRRPGEGRDVNCCLLKAVVSPLAARRSLSLACNNLQSQPCWS